ncbi:MAG: alginate O-acetyltransferase AlgX-related protein [Alphaproteobacteria bacterium]
MTWAPAALAQDAASQVFCEKVADKTLYDDPPLEDYEMLVSGRDGWMFRSRFDLKRRFHMSEKTVGFFTRLKNALSYNGTELVIAMTPTRGLTNPEKLSAETAGKYDHAKAVKNYEDMIGKLRTAGLYVTSPSLTEAPDAFFYPSDSHWSAPGARAMALEVAAKVKSLPAYASISHKKFYTVKKANQTVEVPAKFQRAAEKICGIDAETKILPVLYETRGVNEARDENALFGDKKPVIILLGTSNSSQPAPSFANFEGFLKEYMEADVANEAVSGGSLQGSISQYVLSGRYREDRPKIAIWELASYYGYNKQDFFREIIPAVYGVCTDENILASTEKFVADKQDVFLFENLQNKNIKGHDYYISLQFDDPSVRDISLRFEHADGQADDITLKRSARNFPETNGRYFAEISDAMETPLKNIVLSPVAVAGSARVQLCRAPVFVAQAPVAAAKQPVLEKESLMTRLFRRPAPITIREAELAEDAPRKALPDMRAYSTEEIVQKIPVAQDGKIEIAPMEEAVPLRKFAFDQRLTEMRRLQKRKVPLALHIHAGVYGLPTLAKKFPEYISDEDEGYMVRLPIAVYPGAALVLKDLGKPARLSRGAGSFIASAGDLFIVDSAITGWDETAQAAAELENDKDFRPFITAWDGSRLYMAGAKLSHLGYGFSKSYGLTLSTNEVVQEEFGDPAAPTGWITDSTFENLYFGFYSYEARNVMLYKNRYRNNIMYGIDPHDRSRGMIIADNHVSASQRKHGIILSRDVADSFVFGNVIEYNAGSGLALDRNAHGNVIANNIVRHNGRDGVDIYESSGNDLYDNIIENNGTNGLRIRNSQDIEVTGGRIALNKKQAIHVYEDDLKNTDRDFEQDPVTVRASAVFRNIDIESNGGILKTNGFETLAFRDMKWDKASLRGQRYYGDLEKYASRLDDFERENTGFIIGEK